MRITILLLAVIAFFSLICSSCELLEPIFEDNDWVRVDSLGTDTYSVNFLTDNYGYAVGSKTFYYNGSSWTQETTNSGKDVVIISSTTAYTNAHFYNGIEWINLPFSYGECVTATDENNVWVGGEYGKINYFNGASWTLTQLDLGYIRRIKAINPSLVYAVDRYGKVIKYDGNGWRILYDIGIPQYSFSYISDLELVSDGNFWITYYSTNAYSEDTGGKIYKFTNDQLESELSVERGVRCVFANNMQEAWFGGNKGSMWHYSSGNLKAQTSDTIQTIYDIAATQTEVFAVGAKGIILKRR